MKFLISIITIYIMVYSIRCSLNEIKQYKNYIGASIIFFGAFFQLFYTNLILFTL